MTLSDPEVSTLLQRRFIPVRFSMWLSGPATDPDGRDFVFKDGFYPYPGLILTDADLNVLARTASDCGPRETLGVLHHVLRTHPELAPDGAELEAPIYDTGDPAQAELQALAGQFDRGPAAARPPLIPAFDRWLGQHGARLPDVAAVARALLGDCHYLAGDFARAEELWREVVERHPEHPIRHRCRFNLIDKNVWPQPEHPALQGAARPGVAVHPPEVPWPEVRAINLTAVRSQSRYLRSPGGMPFVEVPAGSFTMGGSPAIYKNELPLRQVTLSQPCLMSAWPVTRGDWRSFRPDSWPDIEGEGLAAELPVTWVTWHEASAWCAWRTGLDQHDGWRYRLPTEAEWERAARGGLEGMRHPWGNEPLEPRRANYNGARAVPVASYPPNAYGLFDMLGNVAEYCRDRYHGGAYGMTSTEVVDPAGPDEREQPRDLRVVRASVIGAGFSEMISYVSWRAGNDADRAVGCFGFRVVAERS